MSNTILSVYLPSCFVNKVDCIVHAEGKFSLTPRAPCPIPQSQGSMPHSSIPGLHAPVPNPRPPCPSPQSQTSVPHSSIPGIHAGLSPEFLIELAGLAVVGSLGSAVVVQGSHCQVVHVEPDGSRVEGHGMSLHSNFTSS